MKYLICYTGTGLANSCFYGTVSYKMKAAAVKKVNKLNKDKEKGDFELLTLDEYEKRCSETVMVRSSMNGAMVEISKVDLGTCCDPSTELYWTM